MVLTEGNGQRFTLNVLMQPDGCQKSRKSSQADAATWMLQPPSIVEMISEDGDMSWDYLDNPFWCCTVELKTVSSTSSTHQEPESLMGSTISSLQIIRSKDENGKPRQGHGVFVFQDLKIRKHGTYRLTYTLYERRQRCNGGWQLERLGQVDSKPFSTGASRQRMSEQLLHALCEAGVRITIPRKNKGTPTIIGWPRDRSQLQAWTKRTSFPPSSTRPDQRGFAQPAMGNNDARYHGPSQTVPPMSHQVNLGSHWQADQSRLHRQDQSSRGEGVPDHPTHDTIGGVHDNWELNRKHLQHSSWHDYRRVW